MKRVCEKKTHKNMRLHSFYLTRQTIDNSFKQTSSQNETEKVKMKNRIGNSEILLVERFFLNDDISCIIYVLTCRLNVLQSFYNINKDQTSDYAHKSSLEFENPSDFIIIMIKMVSAILHDFDASK